MINIGKRRELFFDDYLIDTDFISWTPQRQIKTDGEDIQYYTNGVMPYPRAPHIYVGFPTRCVERKAWTPTYDELCGKEERLAKMKASAREGLALTDCLFMASRDGYEFTRYDEAFMTPPLESAHSWYYGDCYPAAFLLETDSYIPENREYSIFCNSTDVAVADDHATALCRYTIRLDGFVSLHAGGREELVSSKPFTYDGENLFANIHTSARGYAYFTLKCDGEEYVSYEVFGNSPDKKIHFTDEGAVKKCKGRRVTLEVRMMDTHLFAIRFGD